MIIDTTLLNADDFYKTETKFQKRHMKRLYAKLEKAANNILPVEKKLIILVDIVGFSKRDTYEQWADILIFQHYLKTQALKNKLFLHKVNVTHFVPTGDGCYIIANECDPEIAVDFVYSIIQGFQKVQPRDEYPLSIRASALLGDVVPFMDISKHVNYIGEGMNEGSRILSGGQKALEENYIKQCQAEGINPSSDEIKQYSRNSLFLDDSLASFAKDYFSKENAHFYFEKVADKHGKTRNITVLQGIK